MPAERGMQGDIGHEGPKGERGAPGVAPWPVRNAVAAYSLVCIGVALAFYLFYTDDKKDDREQRRALEQRRTDLIMGCNRSNDLRKALTDVINTGYAQRPIPDGLTTKETERIMAENVRREEERKKQLSHEGLRIIDCEAAFPPLNLK